MYDRDESAQEILKGRTREVEQIEFALLKGIVWVIAAHTNDSLWADKLPW